MEPRERDVAGLSIGLSRPAGEFEKTKLFSATRQYHFKIQTVIGRPAGGPYILIFDHVPLPRFHIA